MAESHDKKYERIIQQFLASLANVGGTADEYIEWLDAAVDEISIARDKLKERKSDGDDRGSGEDCTRSEPGVLFGSR